jgi:hypothetical protein
MLVPFLSANATLINLNDFFADPTVSVATDGSSATIAEDLLLNPVLLANDPGLGDPEVITPGILSFDFIFNEGAGDDDEFGAFVLGADGFSLGPEYEFFTRDSSSGTVSFDLSPFSGSVLGLQFQLASLFEGTIEDGRNLNSIVTVSNVQLTPVPEPATMILVGTGLVGLLGLGRKKFRKIC